MKKKLRLIALFLAFSMLVPNFAAANELTKSPISEAKDEEKTAKETENTESKEEKVESEEAGDKEDKENPEDKEDKENPEDKEDKENEIVFPKALEISKAFELDDKVERIGGKNRYETSVAISKSLLDAQSMVIVASGQDFPDALAGSNLVKGKFPIVLTEKDYLPEEVEAEIKRLNPEKILILGGENAISKTVENSLASITSVNRIAGEDRFETALAISKYNDNKNVILSDGLNFPDALAVTALSNAKDSSIILTRKDSLPKVVKEYIVSDKLKSVDIIGGTNAVNKSVEEELYNIGSTLSNRYSGKDRFETSVVLAEELKKTVGESKYAIVCNGMAFPDALSASILSQHLNAPILLVDTFRIDDSVVDFLDGNRDNIDKVIVIGGEAAVSPSLVEYIEKCIVDGGEKPEAYQIPILAKHPFEPLKIGYKGENVKLFHQKLKELNYYRGVVDEKFDGESEIALRLFQYCHKLPISNVLSKDIWEKILLDQAKPFDRSSVGKKEITVPYHSQIDGIKAWVACVPTSLLMALQHKGYAKQYNLRSFLNYIPRHESNPAKGYPGTPYQRTDKNPSMWPNVQVSVANKFGAKATDLTGTPLYALQDELYMNNAVVIIPTLYWEPPKYVDYMVEGKKVKLIYNLHGTVLTGYNPANGKYRVTDPYNYFTQGGVAGVPLIMWVDGNTLTTSYNYQKQAMTIWK